MGLSYHLIQTLSLMIILYVFTIIMVPFIFAITHVYAITIFIPIYHIGAMIAIVLIVFSIATIIYVDFSVIMASLQCLLMLRLHVSVPIVAYQYCLVLVALHTVIYYMICYNNSFIFILSLISY